MASDKKLERKEILRGLAEFLDPKDILVAALAGTTNECFHTIHRPANLYMVGMGMVTPVAFGLAKALPNLRIIALDADGSMLLSPSILSVVGAYKPRNLCVVGFDNEQLYGSRGGPKSQTAQGADLAAIAAASGIKSASTARTTDEFVASYARFTANGGPTVIICKVEPAYTRAEGPNFNGQENKFRLVRLIEEWQGVTILETSK